MLTLPRWQLLLLYTNFQTDITWKFCKRFEVCKSLGYSLGIQHFRKWPKKGPWIIPGDPMVILRGSVPLLHTLFLLSTVFKHFSLNISPILDILVIFQLRISQGVQNWYSFKDLSRNSWRKLTSKSRKEKFASPPFMIILRRKCFITSPFLLSMRIPG